MKIVLKTSLTLYHSFRCFGLNRLIFFQPALELVELVDFCQPSVRFIKFKPFCVKLVTYFLVMVSLPVK